MTNFFHSITPGVLFLLGTLAVFILLKYFREGFLKKATAKHLKENLAIAVEEEKKNITGRLRSDLYLRMQYLLESNPSALTVEDVNLRNILDAALSNFLAKHLNDRVSSGVDEELKRVIQKSNVRVYVLMPALSKHFGFEDSELYQQLTIFSTKNPGEVVFGPYSESYAIPKDRIPADARIAEGLYAEWHKVEGNNHQVVSKFGGVRVNCPTQSKQT